MSDDEEDVLKIKNNDIYLKETYICDITKEMFDKE